MSRRRCRALEMLADAGLRGCTGATLVGHGFDIDMIAALVKEGLATAHRETMEALGGTSKADRTRSAASCQSAGTPHSRSG